MEQNPEFYVNQLLDAARQCVSEGAPDKALGMVLAAVRLRGGSEDEVFNVMDEAKEAFEVQQQLENLEMASNQNEPEQEEDEFMTPVTSWQTSSSHRTTQPQHHHPHSTTSAYSPRDSTRVPYGPAEVESESNELDSVDNKASLLSQGIIIDALQVLSLSLSLLSLVCVTYYVQALIRDVDILVDVIGWLQWNLSTLSRCD